MPYSTEKYISFWDRFGGKTRVEQIKEAETKIADINGTKGCSLP